MNKLSWYLIGLQAVMLAAGIGLFAWLGLRFEWTPRATLALVTLVVLAGVWMQFHVWPGGPTDRFVADVTLVTLLILTYTNVGAPFQYAAIAVKFPFVDASLAAADARLAVHVPALTAWTQSHSWFRSLMTVSYFSLIPQILLTLCLLAATRTRERLWEFAFHFHVCLTISLVALMFWPAICAPVFYGYAPTIPMARLIEQIRGFHDGTMTTIRADDLEGLISVPSFHAACGLIIPWAFRGRPKIVVPLVIVNGALVASTIFTGAHYVVDVIASVLMFAGSVLAYRLWGRRLLEPPRGPSASARRVSREGIS